MPNKLPINLLRQRTVEAPIRIAQINVLWCPENTNVAQFPEKIFKGGLDTVTHEALGYIQRNYLYQTVIKHPDRAEVTRFRNFQLAAIEVALVHAANHLPYESDTPIEVRIGYHELTIKSCFSPASFTHLTDGQTTITASIFGPDNPLDPNPSQPPLVRGGADSALPLTRGSWRGFEPVEQSGFNAMLSNRYTLPVLEIDKDSASLLTRLRAHELVQEPFSQTVMGGLP